MSSPSKDCVSRGQLLFACLSLAVTSCLGVTRDPTIFVEGAITDSGRGPLTGCHMIVADSLRGERATLDIHPSFSQSIGLYPDDRNYRFHITCSDHEGAFDTGWLDLRENRRTGAALKLGTVTLTKTALDP